MKDFEQVLRERRSVRGYLPTPVVPEKLKAIFQMAQLAPSNCNTQPWSVFVASGAKRDEIRQKLVEKAVKGAPPEPSVDMVQKYEGSYRQRQMDCAVALYSTVGVERNDKEGRARVALRNFELFDAPHAAFVCMPSEFTAYNAMDVGIYVQTLMLCMQYHGVSSCAQGALTLYPKVLQEAFGFDDSLCVLVGLSFGYEDTSVIANRARIGRAELIESVTFAG